MFWAFTRKLIRNCRDKNQLCENIGSDIYDVLIRQSMDVTSYFGRNFRDNLEKFAQLTPQYEKALT